MKSQRIRGVEVVIDKDPKMRYETNGIINGFFCVSFSLLLSLIPPKIGNFLINKTSKKARKVKNRATTYYALDALYVSHKFSRKNGFFQGIAEYLWFKLGNPRAVRNRLKLVKKILRKIVLSKLKNKEKLLIFSLGCGSARAVIKTIKRVEKLKPKINIETKIKIKLLDKDPRALEFSKKLIIRNNLSKQTFDFIEDKIRNFDKYLDDSHPEIIEMVGVLDYLNDKKAIEIFKKIKKRLPRRGFFITANISENLESRFVTKTVKWPMIYRDPEDLIKILLKAGFKKEKIKIFIEPLKTHIVAQCQK